MADEAQLDTGGLPESFLGKVLREFGVQWTQVTIFIGAALSSLHLTPFIDPAVWIVATALSFVVAYVFRRQVSANFPRVAAAAIVIVGVAIAVPFTILVHRHLDMGNEFQRHRIPYTVYLGFAITTPLAFAILAYRKQEDTLGSRYPAELERAISSDLMTSAFFRKNQQYDIEVQSVNATGVTYNITLTYTAVNRTTSASRITGGYVSPFNRAQLTAVKIGDQSIDVQDPDYRTESGFFVTRTLGPGQELNFQFTAEETFPLTYSENFTAYLPTTSLMLRLRNPFEQLAFSVESLLPNKVDPVRDGDVLTCSVPGGVLPYQGFRLHWRPAIQTAAVEVNAEG